MKVLVIKTSFRSAVVSIALAALAAAPSELHATWYGENVEGGADVMMMDVCWPWWPESTYSAIWNFGINPTGIGGYGGFANGIPSVGPDHRPNFDPAVQAAFHPGSVWSFWGGNKDGEPVRVAASSEYTYPRQYVNEGASGALGSSGWPFMKNGEWYTMMMRVWEPVVVTNAQYSYVGRWIKDISAGQWHLYGIMRLPVPGKSFQGNNGFMEDVGNGGRSVRSLYRRLGYYRKAGEWRSSDKVTINVDPKKGQFDNYWVVQAKPEGDHEFLAMELSSNPALLPQKLAGTPLEAGKQHSFTVKQPAKPALDKPQVASVTAESNGRQVLVKWELVEKSSPQFLYSIEVFNNAACRGVPVAVCQERMPPVRTVVIDAVVANPTVRFSLTDVFDQTAAPMVVAAKAAVRPSPATSVTTAPGLSYELFHKFKEIDKLSLDAIGGGEVARLGIARGFDISLASTVGRGYAFRFKGFLRVPASGLYVLSMQGSDGYRIAVDGVEALTWDGPHGPAERSGSVNLAKGDHAIAVDYFVGRWSSPFFKLEWEGPGMPRQEIPASALFHQDTGQTPAVKMTASGGNDGNASLGVTVNARGHVISKVHLFLGTMQLAESAGTTLAYAGPLLDGANKLWVRVIYDNNCTMDSQAWTMAVKGLPVRDGWTLSVVGEAKAARGIWQTAPDAFAFIGEGEYVITRHVTGDFTLTCRIDSCSGSKGEPVSGWSWAGLTARERGSERSWGEEFGVYQTARFGLRTTPNFSDQGNSRLNDYELPKGQPWVRIVRRGQVWTAWSSADGKNWELGATHLKPGSQDMDAGVVFRALPQDAQAYFCAGLSGVKLEAGVAKDLVMPVSVPATRTDGPRLTGVVVARSDAAVIVVRSSEKGLLRSNDDGKTWNTVNGDLSGAANAVRSVAIDPKNPQIMFRAAGRTGAAGAWDGGLWKTVDGGASWKKLNFQGDFDGNGPSALCGEVITIDPEKPETVFAGCETRGLYRSDDGGGTWAKLGIDGERITAVVVNGWSRGDTGTPFLHAVTCPDALMPLLGRGKPALVAPAKAARDYISHNGGKNMWPICEWTHLGYLNIAFDKGSRDEPSYATTHGYCQSLSERVMFLFPPAKNMESFRPFTAVASTGHGDARCGRALLQALDPVQPGRVSRSEHFALRWDWIQQTGDVPKGGYIAFAGEFVKGDRWWLLATDGLYRSDDGGRTLKKIMDEN